MRAEADSRLVEQPAGQQGYLFDAPDTAADDQLLADYRQRYGLSEDPFAQDYSFPLFTGAGRRQLLDQLLHLCQFSNSLLVVLGALGVGKTRIAHAFMDSLSDQDRICFLSLQSGQSLEQVLTAIAQTFGINAGPLPTAENLLNGLEAHIAEEALVDEEGLSVVVVDNAHFLDDQTLSVLTALLNNFPQQNRLHVALFAEPSLMRRLERARPETLLINDFYLQPFNLAEATDYLNFRMEMADYLGPEIFTESLVDGWWRHAEGNLSELHEAAQERLLESVTPKPRFDKRGLPVAHIVAIAMLIAVVGVVFLYMGDEELTPAPITLAPEVAPVASQAAVSSSQLQLTSTQTPVQPLLQTLPQPQQPNQIAASSQPVQVQPPQPVTEQPATTDQLEFPREEIVPLAQLPTVAPKKNEAPAASNPAVAEPVATVPTKVALPEPKPVALAPEPKPEPVKPVAPPVEKKPLATTANPQERNILAWSPNQYTIQLLGVSNRKAALDYMAAQPNKSDLLMFKSRRQGNDWFVVITGRFASSAEARQAIARLPAGQRDAGPWPRDVKTIQAEIKSVF